MPDTKQTCYLFLDFDGTVFLQGRIPPENRKALAAVQRLGHQLILNTGRARGGLDFGLEQYRGVEWDGMIFGSSDMNYRGRRVYEHRLSDRSALYWVRYALERRMWIRLGSEDGLLSLDFDTAPPASTEEEAVLERARRWMEAHPVAKLSLRRVDEQDMPPYGETVVRMETYAEVLPAGRDKGAAFLDFCGTWGISPEQCICFGDSLNDLAGFTACPNSVAMRQSPPELRRYASYTASGEFGVAEGIEHFFGKICS